MSRQILSRARKGQLCLITVGAGLRLAKVTRQRGGEVVEAAITGRTLAGPDLRGDVLILDTKAHPFDSTRAWADHHAHTFASPLEARTVLARYLKTGTGA